MRESNNETDFGDFEMFAERKIYFVVSLARSAWINDVCCCVWLLAPYTCSTILNAYKLKQTVVCSSTIIITKTTTTTAAAAAAARTANKNPNDSAVRTNEVGAVLVRSFGRSVVHFIRLALSTRSIRALRLHYCSTVRARSLAHTHNPMACFIFRPTSNRWWLARTHTHSCELS